MRKHFTFIEFLATIAIFLSAPSTLLASAPELNMVADPLESYYPLSGRLAASPVRELRFCRGEAGIASAVVFNPSGQTMYCRLEIKGFDALQPVIRETLHIRARLGQLPADALPKISADGVIAVPAGENRQLFLDFATRQAEPGKYRGTLSVRNTISDETAEVGFEIEILPLVIPEKHPLSIMTWDCSLRSATGDGREKLLDLLTESYVNAFHVMERPEFKNGTWDFSKLNSIMKILKGKGLCMLRLAAPPRNPDIMTEAGVEAYKTYIQAVIENLEKEGFRYDEYVFYPYDENTRDNFYAAAKAIKAADPQALVYMDPTPKSTAAELHRVIDGKYVDYVQYSASLTRDRNDIIQPLIGKTKYSSAYWCPVIQKRLRPSGFYRRMGHFAYRYDLNGIGYWTSVWLPNCPKKSMPWDDFSGKIASSVTIYPGRGNNGESIPSRRWRAFRVGLEDYLFFYLLKDKGNPALEKKIQSAVEHPQSSPEYASLKNEIIDFLLEK